MAESRKCRPYCGVAARMTREVIKCKSVELGVVNIVFSSRNLAGRHLAVQCSGQFVKRCSYKQDNSDETAGEL